MTDPLVGALAAIAGADSHGTTGFRAGDETLGASLLAWARSGRELSQAQERAAWRLLSRYVDQLADAGIVYADLPAPVDGQVAAANTAAAKMKAASAAASAPLVYVEDGRIKVRCVYDLHGLMKNVPNWRWDKKAMVESFPASPGQAATVRDALAPFNPTLTPEVVALLAKADEARAAAVFKTRDDLPEIPIRKLSSWNHQRQAFYFARSLDACLLGMGMGTGKSKVSIDLMQNNDTRRALIICPSKTLGVWPKQFRIHGVRDWHVVNGMVENRAGNYVALPVAKRLQQIETTLFDCTCGRPHAGVLNYDALAHEPVKHWRPARGSIDYIIFDEIHKIKSAGGVQSKWCAAVALLCKRRLGLTGTYFPQSPLDIYGQYRALDATIFGTSHRSFMAKYAVEREGTTFGGATFKTVVGLQNEHEMMERFHRIAYLVESSVLELPDVLPAVTHSGTLSPSAAKVYRELEHEMWAEIEHADGSVGEVSVANVLGRMLRQQQITGGAVPTDDGPIFHIDDTKAKMLAETLEETGRVDPSNPRSPWEPVVVIARFHHDLDVIERVTRESGRRYGEISGRSSSGMTRDSTMSPDCDVVGVQIQSGGVSIDLTRSRFIVFYSTDFSLANFDQVLARLDRPGQNHGVLPIYLVCAGTIDETIYTAISKRRSVVDYMLSLRGFQEDNRGNVQRIVPLT